MLNDNSVALPAILAGVILQEANGSNCCQAVRYAFHEYTPKAAVPCKHSAVAMLCVGGLHMRQGSSVVFFYGHTEVLDFG